MILINFLLIRLQKSNYYGQNFIILNFSEYKVLKMKFWHRKRYKIKDSTDEISSKYNFTQYNIMITTNFYSYGCKNPIIRDKN